MSVETCDRPESIHIENLKVRELLSLGKVEPLDEWINYPEMLELDPTDVPALLSMALNEKLLYEMGENSTELWAPLHALRALGQLKSPEVIEPLLHASEILDDHDWMRDDLRKVFCLIGEPSLEPLIYYFLHEKVICEFWHAGMSEALGLLVETYPQFRMRVLDAFKQYMQAPNLELETLNGLVISTLLDLKAVELIDDIRHFFSLNCVEEEVAGDIEEVEIELGFRTERATPKKSNKLRDDMLRYLRTLRDDDDDDDDDYAPFYADESLPSVETYFREGPKTGRNEPCPCGSKKKYKKCCGG